MSRTKLCPGCNLTKDFDEFHVSKATKTGRSCYCKVCKKIKRRREYWSDVITNRIASAHQTRKTRYGITKEQYAAMLDDQNFLCALCGKPETSKQKEKIRLLSVDHDHATGIIRGLLCRSCNLMLGNANDDPELLRKAADYIEQNR